MIKFEYKIGISDVIAAIALMLSGIAIWQSVLARNDAKVFNKFDLRPSLELKAQLQNINDKIPAHIAIVNNGPVDAVQLVIQFHYHKYNPEKKQIRISTGESTQQRWTIDRFPPLNSKYINIDASSLDNLLPSLLENEKYYRILEIRLTYRRDVDLKQYSESAFYFVNQDGKWVSEQSNSLDSDFYTPIKQAAIRRFDMNLPVVHFSDTLHKASD